MPQFAPSSRLASQAPRQSRCNAGFYHGLIGEQETFGSPSRTRGRGRSRLEAPEGLTAVWTAAVSTAGLAARRFPSRTRRSSASRLGGSSYTACRARCFSRRGWSGCIRRRPFGRVFRKIPLELRGHTDRDVGSRPLSTPGKTMDHLFTVEFVLIVAIFGVLPLISYLRSNLGPPKDDLSNLRAYNLPRGSVRAMLALFSIGSFLTSCSSAPPSPRWRVTSVRSSRLDRAIRVGHLRSVAGVSNFLLFGAAVTALASHFSQIVTPRSSHSSWTSPVGRWRFDPSRAVGWRSTRPRGSPACTRRTIESRRWCGYVRGICEDSMSLTY